MAAFSFVPAGPSTFFNTGCLLLALPAKLSSENWVSTAAVVASDDDTAEVWRHLWEVLRDERLLLPEEEEDDLSVDRRAELTLWAVLWLSDMALPI
jgi:hypothetical protein